MLKIAIQSKGRLADQSRALLNQYGLEFSCESRSDKVRCTKKNVELLLLRDDDIPQYVERGIADFGIVGKNVLCEKSANVRIQESLNFGQCSLVIAVPKNSLIKTVTDLEGERIATSYPNILRAFLERQNITGAIIELKGSVEVAPSLNLADAICDLTQTGTTLRANNLRIITTIFESQAALISAPTITASLQSFL